MNTYSFKKLVEPVVKTCETCCFWWRNMWVGESVKSYSEFATCHESAERTHRTHTCQYWKSKSTKFKK